MSAVQVRPPSPAASRTRSGRRIGAAAVAAALLALLAAAAASLFVPTTARVVPGFDEDVEAVASGWGSTERFGVRGSWIVPYQHDTDIELRVPWDGGAVLDARLGDEPLRLLTVTDARVEGDELVLTVHRDNCRYFHERAIDMFTGIDVTQAHGGTTELLFDRPVFVKSPMLASCPDRTLDRQDDTRGGYDRYDR